MSKKDEKAAEPSPVVTVKAIKRVFVPVAPGTADTKPLAKGETHQVTRDVAELLERQGQAVIIE